MVVYAYMVKNIIAVVILLPIVPHFINKLFDFRCSNIVAYVILFIIIHISYK